MPFWVENIVRKREIAVTSNFSFPNNVFHGCISLVRQNAALRGNGLIRSQTPNLRSSKQKVFAYDNFKFDGNGRKLTQKGRKHCGNRRNCSLQAISTFFHSVFKRFVLQTGKNKGLFDKMVKLLYSIVN